MKLPIRHEYFELIKKGLKNAEYRDSHITFIDEETGEKITKPVIRADMVTKATAIRKTGFKEFTDDFVLRFKLG